MQTSSDATSLRQVAIDVMAGVELYVMVLSLVCGTASAQAPGAAPRCALPAVSAGGPLTTITHMAVALVLGTRMCLHRSLTRKRLCRWWSTCTVTEAVQ